MELSRGGGGAVDKQAVIDQVGEAGDDGAGVFEGDFGKAHQEQTEFPGEHFAVNALARAWQAEQSLEEKFEELKDPGVDLLRERLQFTIQNGGLAPGAVGSGVGEIDLK